MMSYWEEAMQQPRVGGPFSLCRLDPHRETEGRENGEKRMRTDQKHAWRLLFRGMWVSFINTKMMQKVTVVSVRKGVVLYLLGN